jgi:hypothetical protein
MTFINNTVQAIWKADIAHVPKQGMDLNEIQKQANLKM